MSGGFGSELDAIREHTGGFNSGIYGRGVKCETIRVHLFYIDIELTFDWFLFWAPETRIILIFLLLTAVRSHTCPVFPQEHVFTVFLHCGLQPGEEKLHPFNRMCLTRHIFFRRPTLGTPARNGRNKEGNGDQGKWRETRKHRKERERKRGRV